MCSYNSPTFLFQPIELLSLAGIFRGLKKGETTFIDAIAENLNREEVIRKIGLKKLNFIVALSGFECFEEDINEINHIKQQFPDVKIIFFGHYATEFRLEVLKKTAVDYIIHGEPDWVFADLVEVLEGKLDAKEVKGISYKLGSEFIHQEGSSRITNINELPMPAFDLLKNEHYGEPFFEKPYGLIQSARGCPYKCNFCVTSFGSKLVTLTPENIIIQIESYIKHFDIKAFRFIDDTFTANTKRVIEFCKLLISKDYKLKWSCLVRPDKIDPVMIDWMQKAGCIRVYVGVESGSQKVLDFYDKKYKIEDVYQNLEYIKQKDMELFGFFMVGAPNETLADVKKSISLALKLKFDYIAISTLTLYPGTALFNKLSEKISFSILPYQNEYDDPTFHKNAKKYQRYFMFKFYFNHHTIRNILFNWAFKSFPDVSKNVLSFSKYLFLRKKTVREDYI
jgi:radical SAM superfamily enzyme YgiQ (UPF0313 family)